MYLNSWRGPRKPSIIRFHKYVVDVWHCRVEEGEADHTSIKRRITRDVEGEGMTKKGGCWCRRGRLYPDVHPQRTRRNLGVD